MGLFLQKKLEPVGELGLWTIEEAEDYFLSLLELLPVEKHQLDQIKGRKRIEWLAARLLVHRMSGRSKRGAFIKDEFGKPHLENSPFQISISHAKGMAAAVAAPGAVGIDIQHRVEKIERIAHKYLSKAEWDSLEANTRIEQLHIYWGAKEALYKAYGRRQLDFCSHILVEPFQLNEKAGKLVGKVHKGDIIQDYHLYYEMIGDYFLVYALSQLLKPV